MKNETIKQTAERVCDSISAVRRQDRLPIIDKSIRQHVDPLLQQKQELRDELERLLSIITDQSDYDHVNEILERTK